MTTLTTEEVLEMARQAGFTSGEVAWHDNMFETFAKLVAEKSASVEREACAKVCDAESADIYNADYYNEAARVCAAKIRAIGATT
jgi:hypothetical protein